MIFHQEKLVIWSKSQGFDQQNCEQWCCFVGVSWHIPYIPLPSKLKQTLTILQLVNFPWIMKPLYVHYIFPISNIPTRVRPHHLESINLGFYTNPLLRYSNFPFSHPQPKKRNTKSWVVTWRSPKILWGIWRSPPNFSRMVKTRATMATHPRRTVLAGWWHRFPQMGSPSPRSRWWWITSDFIHFARGFFAGGISHHT